MRCGTLIRLAVVLSLASARLCALSTNHWAFLPLREEAPPVDRTGWSRTPIDPFILAKLAASGGAPAAGAEARVLLRRIYFDLIGLPPGPADAERFLGEFERNPEDAVNGLIDRLLAAPQYGERWGRWWLDVARYADTNGQDENKVMANAWRYRDWVVRAFNGNKPFDQFVTEQLAGDLLPAEAGEQANFDHLIATGFLVLGPKMLAEQDKPKLVMDIIDEQIDTVGRTFLGLTLGCARCHDHKFDPVPTRDYYALAGIFKSTKTMADLAFVSKFNERPVASKRELAAVEAHQQRMLEQTNRLERAIRQANEELIQSWKDKFSQDLAAGWEIAMTGKTPGAATNTAQKLGALMASDPATHAISRRLREAASHPEQAREWLRGLEVLPETEGARQLGPGRVGAGWVARGQNYLELPHAPELDPPALTVEAWVRAETFPKTGETRRWLVNKNGNEWIEGHYALLLDRDQAGAYLNIGGGRDHVFSVWSGTALEAKRWHHLAFTYDGADLRLFVDGKAAGETRIGLNRVPGKSALALGRRQDGYVAFEGSLDEAHVYDRALSPAELKEHYENPEKSDREHRVANWDFNELTAEEQDQADRAAVREALLGPGGVYALPKEPRALYAEKARQELDRLEAERARMQAAAPPDPAWALAVEEDKPVDLPVHLRGSHLNLGKDSVPRGFVSTLPGGEERHIPPNHSGRLELARWLTDPRNPLTARVMVNRIWQAHFGEGLVRTADNFGVRGEAPSHPELLDWLARTFIASGWDVKALHRLILRSAAYQQSSKAGSGDFSRAVDPENRFLGHFPRQRLEAEMIRDSLLFVSGRLDPGLGGAPAAWKNNEYVPGDEISPGSVRRTLYLPIVRDRVFDALTIFDFANPSVCSAKRTTTVVSHQALFFLNSPLVKDSAAALARQLLARSDLDEPRRIAEAYWLLLGRRPSPGELARAERFLADLPPAGGAGKSAPEGRAEDLAALCQTVMASNEFVYRY